MSIDKPWRSEFKLTWKFWGFYAKHRINSPTKSMRTTIVIERERVRVYGGTLR